MSWKALPPVLGFDIGTACGWALVEADQVRRSGALDLRPGDHPGHRYLKLSRWLAGECWPENLSVAVEDIRSHSRTDKVSGKKFFGTDAAHVYGGLRAIVEGWAASRSIQVFPIGVGTWKAAIGCSGGSHAPKEEVMRAVRLLGHSPRTQDEADAIGVALHAYRAQRARRS